MLRGGVKGIIRTARHPGGPTSRQEGRRRVHRVRDVVSRSGGGAQARADGDQERTTSQGNGGGAGQPEPAERRSRGGAMKNPTARVIGEDFGRGRCSVLSNQSPISSATGRRTTSSGSRTTAKYLTRRHRIQGVGVIRNRDDARGSKDGERSWIRCDSSQSGEPTTSGTRHRARDGGKPLERCLPVNASRDKRAHATRTDENGADTEATRSREDSTQTTLWTSSATSWRRQDYPRPELVNARRPTRKGRKEAKKLSVAWKSGESLELGPGGGGALQ